jgi:hypothetical protein
MPVQRVASTVDLITTCRDSGFVQPSAAPDFLPLQFSVPCKIRCGKKPVSLIALGEQPTRLRI